MNTNKRIIVVLIFICLLFLSLLVYLTYFTVFESERLVRNEHNRRRWVSEQQTLRGTIYDRNGEVLARSSRNDDGSQTRRYPHGSLYAHVIGYNSVIYGRSQLEVSFNDLLMGHNRWAGVMGIEVKPDSGFDLTLSIDHRVQQVAARQLGQRNGAVVAIDPRNGEILAMVGFPSFDPNEEALARNWVSLTENPDSPLLARPTSGLYAPGSSFKIITTAALLADGKGDVTINDQGSIIVGGQRFQNFRERAMGNINLSDAFTRSSNVAFCEWSVEELGRTRLSRMAERFGFGRAISADVPVAVSRFPQRDMTNAEVAMASIGQWEILSTPLNMARVAGIIANGGQDMPLHLVSHATNSYRFIVYDARKSLGSRVISTENANELKEMMVRAVNDANGTGGQARVPGVRVAGKTGTAETDIPGRTHAWFVGFAPADNPRVAIAVVLESTAGGSGGGLAAPIAKEVIRAAL
jgi:peptidoglycan glycosyltransferase